MPKTAESERERVRLWRQNNPERKREIEKRYYHNKLKHREHQQRFFKKKCGFCGILLAAESVGKNRRKYCEPCLRSPKLKKWLESVYNKRKHAKKTGRPVPKIKYVEPELSPTVLL